MDAKLMWSVVDPFIMVDANDLRWEKSLIAHKPNASHAESSSTKTKPDSHLPKPPSISLKKSSAIRNITPMKPAEKRKGRASDTFDSKQAATDKHAARSVAPNMPAGCKWSNNSCAYDAVLFILYNMWRSDDTRYSIERHMLGEYSLEEEYQRRSPYDAAASLWGYLLI
ncbi:hypothetical protein ARMGADRAFT_1071027 [Armillaria gallica]|uniref:Uncharacterized protein n=1 Tax=Armillaria gallica TaxID=47427 RepID=A0A2H3EZ82_ARMGA|nr:hypothetical protein ARMGADRAFT_1071027 [Armillaria gallica]